MPVDFSAFLSIYEFFQTARIEQETEYKKNILKKVKVSADIVPNDTKILLEHLPVQLSATDAQQTRFLKGFKTFEIREII